MEDTRPYGKCAAARLGGTAFTRVAWRTEGSGLVSLHKIEQVRNYTMQIASAGMAAEEGRMQNITWGSES